jgi:catechol 2,3-dioxygenase-like lactoylglutathione lyase family enzyme
MLQTALKVTGIDHVVLHVDDLPRAKQFYVDLLGMEVTYDGPEGAFITADGKSMLFQQVTGYNPPRWPDPAYPQQAHLDIIVDDLESPDMARRYAAPAVRSRPDLWELASSPPGGSRVYRRR